MKNDSVRFTLAYLGTILLAYGLPRLGFPQIVIQAAFLGIILYVYQGRDNLFWLVWYFALINAPGGLFESTTTGSVMYGLPVYRLGSGVAIGFGDLILVAFILKAIRIRRPNPFIYKRQVWLIMAMGLLYLMISFAQGISAQNVIVTVRALSSWAWLLLLPVFMSQPEDLVRLYRLLLPIVIISFAAVMHTYITGDYIGFILAGRQNLREVVASDESLARVNTAIGPLFISLALSLYFMSKKRVQLNQNTMVAVTVIVTSLVFLSGTRGWTIGLLVLFISFFFISGLGFFKQLARVLVILGILFAVTVNVFPGITSQASLAFARLLTVESLVEGDVTAGGTLSRIDIRTPIVMGVWRESPLIGWAFSNTYYSYLDYHIGHPNNLLNLGILGFIPFNLIYLYVIIVALRRGRSRRFLSRGQNSHLVLVFSLIALYVVHSTSVGLWRLGSNHATALMFALVMSTIHIELTARDRDNMLPEIKA